MPYTDIWRIIDANSAIFSGSENEMKDMFFTIVYGGNPDNIEWTGDIELIQVHDISR